MSDSFTTAPRLNPTTVTHTTEPVPDLTDISQATDYLILPRLCSFLPPSFLPSLYSASSLLTTHPTGIPPQPTHAACFPIPHSTLVVARTPREEVTNRSRVSQDPANPSWYKIAPRGSQPETRTRIVGSGKRLVVIDVEEYTRIKRFLANDDTIVESNYRESLYRR